jgi:hypothetical protein
VASQGVCETEVAADVERCHVVETRVNRKGVVAIFCARDPDASDFETARESNLFLPFSLSPSAFRPSSVAAIMISTVAPVAFFIH